VELLEDRLVPAVFDVTATTTTGAVGDLVWAVNWLIIFEAGIILPQRKQGFSVKTFLGRSPGR